MNQQVQQQDNKHLKVTILSPDETIYEGDAQAISCHNPKGSFDVLYEHTNFMSMIDTQVTVLETNGHQRNFPVEQALIQVQENEVTILINVQITQKDSFFGNLFHKK